MDVLGAVSCSGSVSWNACVTPQSAQEHTQEVWRASPAPGQLGRSFQYCWDVIGFLWAAPEALMESTELLPAVSQGPWGSLLAGFSRLWERRDLFSLCWVGKLLLGELLCHTGRGLSVLWVAFDHF